eukprot:gene7985-9380_t
MVKPKVVAFNKVLPDDLVERLEKHFEVTTFDKIDDGNRARFEEAMLEAEGIVSTNYKVDRAFIERSQKLRAVSTISSGYDNYDVQALTERNIPLMHTPDVLSETMADTMMALTLAVARRVVELDAFTRAGKWAGAIPDCLFGTSVHHKTMGIVGMGRIGLSLARRAALGFSMPVLYTARTVHQDVETLCNAKRVDIDQLLAESDFVVVVMPLSTETRHYFNAQRFSQMKKTAFFVNGGRGPVVDESALCDALKQGIIAGAGLDVFEVEPLSTASPLVGMTNVVLLPHAGSATKETRYDMKANAVDNLIAAMNKDISKNYDLIDKLKKQYDVSYFEELSEDNRVEFDEALIECEGILVDWRLPRDMWARAVNLKAVSIVASGCDGVPVEELKARNILVANTKDPDSAETVSDNMMALVLSVARKTAYLDQSVRKGEWKSGVISTAWFGTGVHHKTMGIVGMGRIGLSLARRAALGFSMPVLYTARTVHQDVETLCNAKRVDIDQLLEQSDYFSKMKQTAYFINAGRGAVVDEPALCQALEKGIIAGAGLD